MHIKTGAELPPHPTQKQAAEFIGVDVKTIRRWIAVVIRTPAAWLLLSGSELDRLFAFAKNGAHIQRFPMSPRV
jgi:hypothetical protein